MKRIVKNSLVVIVLIALLFFSALGFSCWRGYRRVWPLVQERRALPQRLVGIKISKEKEWITPQWFRPRVMPHWEFVFEDPNGFQNPAYVCLLSGKSCNVAGDPEVREDEAGRLLRRLDNARHKYVTTEAPKRGDMFWRFANAVFGYTKETGGTEETVRDFLGEPDQTNVGFFVHLRKEWGTNVSYTSFDYFFQGSQNAEKTEASFHFSNRVVYAISL